MFLIAWVVLIVNTISLIMNLKDSFAAEGIVTRAASFFVGVTLNVMVLCLACHVLGWI